MIHSLLHVGNIRRADSFPFQVKLLFYCNDARITGGERKWNDFEVCFRLNSDSLAVRDVVNGVELDTPCPHVIFRRPGAVWETSDDRARDTFSFNYSPEAAEKLSEIGMLPDFDVQQIVLTEEIKKLIGEIRSITYDIHRPKAIDTLDWLCFRLLGALRLQHRSSEEVTTPEARIRNIAAWFHMNYGKTIDLDAVAQANGMSHTNFFRMWKKYFTVSPLQYIMDIRLTVAAELLLKSNLAISEIIQMVNISGDYTFYKRFREKYHMTPNEYRRR